jgi:hypothetical protein
MHSRETVIGPCRKKSIAGGLLINDLLLNLDTGISEEMCYKTKRIISLSSQTIVTQLLTKWPPIIKKIDNLHCKIEESMLAGFLLPFNDDI